jgi:hypothetical protein
VERNDTDNSAEVAGVRPHYLDPEMNSQSGKEDKRALIERLIAERQFFPGEPGWSYPGQQHREETLQEEERQQPGTPSALEANIEISIDAKHRTVNELRAQAYPTQWLMSHDGIPAATAAIIESELGIESAQ